MSIKLLYLKNFMSTISGDAQVIAEVTPDNLDISTVCFQLKNPAVCAITEQGVGLAPLSPVMRAPQTITIKAEDILFIADIVDELKSIYNKKFGSGIVTANANILNQLGNNRG